MNSDSKNLKKGFTLAEILITIGIIGVVAALTIPVLITKYEDAQFKTAYKKAFSDASNIWRQMALNNEVEPCITSCDTGCTNKNFATFKTYIKNIKTCGEDLKTDNVKGCWELSGESANEYAKVGSGSEAPNKTGGGSAIGIIDNSGRQWVMLSGGQWCQSPLLVDTNGFNPPNVFGKDRQVFLGALEDGTAYSFKGLPTKLVPYNDAVSISVFCGHPPCYGKSWLYK